ncbi:hypothetical protein N7537_010761 [Penicillium hordei]|jgi:hypothetical protein|uniref:Uncharacterized protein n=1 Tax=Penicillium hordei TaxID=40994 RepID=A0AAD6DKH2_9EURO|nr:uncharacterized protein N7537_010761 [Penicillium hordei]KAJ5588083.1 hypothetical protein N7537_010761 [Penicillium hordei]
MDPPLQGNTPLRQLHADITKIAAKAIVDESIPLVEWGLQVQYTYLQRILVSRWQKESEEEWNLRRVDFAVDFCCHEGSRPESYRDHENRAITPGQLEAGHLEQQFSDTGVCINEDTKYQRPS